jgi:hypothetical protein
VRERDLRTTPFATIIAPNFCPYEVLLSTFARGAIDAAVHGNACFMIERSRSVHEVSLQRICQLIFHAQMTITQLTDSSGSTDWQET